MSTASNKNKKSLQPTEEQADAIKIMQSTRNIFLTGAAGTGKSFVLRNYLESTMSKTNKIPILASTGAAAVLIEGRTFHSFFGLGIMDGGLEACVNKALKSDKVCRRIEKATEIVIDEISMIHPLAFYAADKIARAARGKNESFGGLRVICIGDFFQLPPVNRDSGPIPWLFESMSWQALDFENICLKTPMRCSEEHFIEILQDVRLGGCSPKTQDFLNARKAKLNEDFAGTVLFGRKDRVEAFNRQKLNRISSPMKEFETEFDISDRCRLTEDQLLANSPIPR